MKISRKVKQISLKIAVSFMLALMLVHIVVILVLMRITDNTTISTAESIIYGSPGFNVHNNTTNSVLMTATKLLSHYNCSDHNQNTYNIHLPVCTPVLNNRKPFELVLMTSIYHNMRKRHIFQLMLMNWSLLKPHILPVLHLSDISMVDNSGDLIKYACAEGWVVVLAPKCLYSGYPLLDGMFHHAVQNYEAHWYGFSNGDILHTEHLWKVLKELRQKPNTLGLKFKFVTSRRYNVQITESSHLITTPDLMQFKKKSRLHRADAMDWFAYHRSESFIQHIPPFAIGRKAYDNWLIYNALKSNMTALEITYTVPAIHLTMQGQSLKESSHRGRKQDEHYNSKLIKGMMSKNWFNMGHVDCIPNVMLLHKQGRKSKLKIHKLDNESSTDFVLRKRLVRSSCKP